MELLHQHKDLLDSFAQGLVASYDADKDDDDIWTTFKFPDGSFADVNIYLVANGKRETLMVAAYAVDTFGEMQTDEWLVLHKQPLARKDNRRSLQ